MRGEKVLVSTCTTRWSSVEHALTIPILVLQLDIRMLLLLRPTTRRRRYRASVGSLASLDHSQAAILLEYIHKRFSRLSSLCTDGQSEDHKCIRNLIALHPEAGGMWSPLQLDSMVAVHYHFEIVAAAPGLLDRNE